jgi:hypothetical protein
VLQLARENRSWGYKRIVGALDNVGHQASRETVANILKRHGMAPAPERGKRMLWKDFIQSHLEVLAAVDFFTAEVWTTGGLTTYYVLVFRRIAPRQICIADFTPWPEVSWTKQIGPEYDDGRGGDAQRLPLFAARPRCEVFRCLWRGPAVGRN